MGWSYNGRMHLDLGVAEMANSTPRGSIRPFMEINEFQFSNKTR